MFTCIRLLALLIALGTPVAALYANEAAETGGFSEALMPNTTAADNVEDDDLLPPDVAFFIVRVTPDCDAGKLASVIRL